MSGNQQTLSEVFGNIFVGLGVGDKNKIDEIYLDADNVLVGWWTYVEENHLNGWTQEQLNELPPANRKKVIGGIYDKDPDLFARLKPYRNAVAFVLHLRELNVPVYILTAAGNDHPDINKVAVDKRECLHEYFGFNDDKIIVVEESSVKQKFSGAGKLLVDDFARNVREWRIHKGTAIHFDSEKGDDFGDLFNNIKALLGIRPDNGPIWGTISKVEE